MSQVGPSDEANRSTNTYKLQITVSDPQKKTGDVNSSTAYVSYQISTKTDNPSYHKNKSNYTNSKKININDIIVVHRRYSDLLLLHNILASDHPSCIIPPLPDKKIFQYIAGDRFSQRFTQKRCHSLQNFLQRISIHPVLRNSTILEMFLTSDDWDSYKKNLIGTLPTSKDEVTDTFMNAFKSAHNQNEIFLQAKSKNDKLDHTIVKLDKIFHKVVKKNDTISEDFSKLSTNLQDLNEVISGSTLEKDEKLSEKIKVFNDGIVQLSYGLSDLNKFLDYEYLVDLKDMEHYIESMRQLIKLKDQKQIDYEQLNEYLSESIKERDNLISGYGGNFITNKLEELAGINQETTRRDKINKLEVKITSLTNELESAKKIADAFEQEAIKEVNNFENAKTAELKESLSNLADNNITYYEKMLETWTKIDKSLEES